MANPATRILPAFITAAVALAALAVIGFAGDAPDAPAPKVTTTVAGNAGNAGAPDEPRCIADGPGNGNCHWVPAQPVVGVAGPGTPPAQLGIA